MESAISLVPVAKNGIDGKEGEMQENECKSCRQRYLLSSRI